MLKTIEQADSKSSPTKKFPTERSPIKKVLSQSVEAENFEKTEI